MKVRSLEPPHEEVVWDLRPSRWPVKSKLACRSKIQYESGQMLSRRYPLDPILEDVTIPKTRMSLDFFLPQRSIAVEIQGQQHYTQNSFFHKTKADFLKQKKRDSDKSFFCELNGIQLIVISKPEELMEYINDT
tara:strand:+ start:151 stop:552 length:402 start_codon:yes stop_codon:yes gene_type:complete